MSDEEPILKPGQPSISQKYNEPETRGFRLILPVSFINYLKQRAKQEKMSASEYLRRLIKSDIDKHSLNAEE